MTQTTTATSIIVARVAVEYCGEKLTATLKSDGEAYPDASAPQMAIRDRMDTAKVSDDGQQVEYKGYTYQVYLGFRGKNSYN